MAFSQNEDELFLVIKGTLYIDFRNQETVKVNEGEIIIVPKVNLGPTQES